MFNSDDPNRSTVAGCLKDLDQCKEMTNAVLKYGCEIEDTIGYSAKANALFELCYYWPMEKADANAPAEALQYLLGIGYEKEQANEEGQTPLLWIASSYQPQVIKCLKVLLEHQVNLHAVDDEGKGALHCALLPPHIIDNWRSLGLISQGVPVSKFYYLPSHVYHTEDRAHANDYDHAKIHQVLWGAEHQTTDLTAPDPSSSVMQLFIQPQWLHDPTFRASNGMDPTSQVADGQVWCTNLNGERYRIQEPVKVLKTRLMFKVLTLLEAGCDPNVLDKAGHPPTYYARRDGLWPQWYWALDNAGYTYDVKTDRWSNTRMA